MRSLRRDVEKDHAKAPSAQERPVRTVGPRVPGPQQAEKTYDIDMLMAFLRVPMPTLVRRPFLEPS